jgi:hypothetical protein
MPSRFVICACHGWCSMVLIDAVLPLCSGSMCEADPHRHPGTSKRPRSAEACTDVSVLCAVYTRIDMWSYGLLRRAIEHAVWDCCS